MLMFCCRTIHPIRPKHLCKQASNVLLPSCMYSARSPTNPNLSNSFYEGCIFLTEGCSSNATIRNRIIIINILQKESEGHKDLRFLFRTHSVLEPVGTRSPLRSGRRKTDVPRTSCALLSAANKTDRFDTKSI